MVNEEYQNNGQSKRKIENKQDVQKVKEMLLEKKEQIIDEAPKLLLEVKNAPYHLNVLFEQDGTPKDNFRIADRYRKRVYYAFKHSPRKSST